MLIRTFLHLSVVLPIAVGAFAQDPAPLPIAPDTPRTAPPAEADPPLVQVPGTGLRPAGVLPPLRYPSLGHLCRVQGDVTVRLILGVDGVPHPIGEAGGPPLLREAGRDYVRSVRFEPVLVDGRPVRAISTATVPFQFQGAEAGPAATGYLLRLEAGATALEPLRGKLDAQLRAWLAGLGLADRSGATADPAATLLVKASLGRTTPGKPDVDLAIQFRRLEDQDQDEGRLLLEKRVLRFGRRLGDGPDEVLAAHLQGLLDQMVRPWEKPAKAREAEFRLASELATGRPLKALDFAFEKMRVRFMPPVPPYPPLAKIAHIQGKVVVEVVVDEQGLPILAQAVEGPPQLRAVAEAYAMTWQFEPAKSGNLPVRARFKLTMNYALH